MSNLVILESVGPVRTERPVRAVVLAADDVSSGVTSNLRRIPNGAPVYSCERWLRVSFSPNLGIVTKVRFWCANLNLRPGWSLRYGISATYRQPTTARSTNALLVPPETDPGEDFVNVMEGPLVGPGMQYSPYIVFQATAIVDGPGLIQGTPLDLRFAWREA